MLPGKPGRPKGYLLATLFAAAAVLLSAVPVRAETSLHRLERKTSKFARKSVDALFKAGVEAGGAAFQIALDALLDDDDGVTISASLGRAGHGDHAANPASGSRPHSSAPAKNKEEPLKR